MTGSRVVIVRYGQTTTLVKLLPVHILTSSVLVLGPPRKPLEEGHKSTPLMVVNSLTHQVHLLPATIHEADGVLHTLSSLPFPQTSNIHLFLADSLTV